MVALNLSVELRGDVQRLLDEEVPAVHKDQFYAMLEQVSKTGQSDFSHKYCRFPIPPALFITSPNYLNKGSTKFVDGNPPEVYPEVLKSYAELNSGQYIDAVLTGPIGTAKTSMAVWTTAYQLYLLSCFSNPHRELGVAKSDEILFIFQNLNKELAKVGFARFKATMENSPYFAKYFPFDPNIKSKLVFPQRIEVVPLAGVITASIGQDVYGGIIDEVNFMEVVEKSKRTRGKKEYDQAEEIYSSISIRRQTRFMKKGELAGIMCLVSSRNYPGQLTDLKEEQAKTQLERTGKTNIFVYDKKIWEVKPWDFGEKRFYVFKGTKSRKPRLLKDKEVVNFYEDEVISIPVEFFPRFDGSPGSDLLRGLRDVGGASTTVGTKFIIDVDAVDRALGKVESIFSEEWVDFKTQQLELLVDNLKNKDEPRAIHVDLAYSPKGDSAGFAIGYVSKFIDMKLDAGDNFWKMEKLPVVTFDGLLEIRSPPDEEIIFSKIRDIIYLLRDKLGINIRWITFDGFQSKDSMQILADKGYSVGYLSVDDSMDAYQRLKMGFTDNRILAPAHEKVQYELVNLEVVKNGSKWKVDHPPGSFSKDVSDAMAGVVQWLCTRREIYDRWDAQPVELPSLTREPKRITLEDWAN